MTNREKYKEAFSVLDISGNFSLEVKKMADIKQKQLKKFKTIAAAFAICVLLIGATGTAYAADLGGIQRTIQLWIHGDQTNVTVDFSTEGSYDMKYTDKDGKAVERGGGGVAFNEDGSTRPLTKDELLDQMNAPDVEYKDDGTVLVYYFDQVVDITDKFEDGICYVKLQGEGKVLYMTVKYDNGYSYSFQKYPNPKEFN